MKEKHVAIVLAAGKGRRMRSDKAKQYLLLKEKPVLFYALKAFERCPWIDEVILVTGETECEYCKKEIVEKYEFQKVKKIVSGGNERYESVYKGIQAIEEAEYVYIHDGARPFIDEGILRRLAEDVKVHQACVAAMPVKDTIKISDAYGFVRETPNRSFVWQIQTPQVFAYKLIKKAYEMLYVKLKNGEELQVTDDAMVVECTTHTKIKLTEGSYTNLKITTPDDLVLAETLVN